MTCHHFSTISEAGHYCDVDFSSSMSWITKDDYDKKLQELKDRQYRLNIELEEHTKADHEYHIQISTVLNLARKIRTIFESSEPIEKRAILNYLLQNPTVSAKNLEFEIRKPYNLILKLHGCPNWLRVVDEITTYFRTTSEYHYIPNLKDGIYPLVRPATTI